MNICIYKAKKMADSLAVAFLHHRDHRRQKVCLSRFEDQDTSTSWNMKIGVLRTIANAKELGSE